MLRIAFQLCASGISVRRKPAHARGSGGQKRIRYAGTESSARPTGGKSAAKHDNATRCCQCSGRAGAAGRGGGNSRGESRSGQRGRTAYPSRTTWDKDSAAVIAGNAATTIANAATTAPGTGPDTGASLSPAGAAATATTAVRAVIEGWPQSATGANI